MDDHSMIENLQKNILSQDPVAPNEVIADPAYDEYWQEQAALQHKMIQEQSNTSAYMKFFAEKEVLSGSFAILGKLGSFHEDRIKKEFDSNEAWQPEDGIPSSAKDYIEEQISREGAAINAALEVVLQSQRNQLFANLYNSFENYLIDLCKSLLISYPRAVKISANSTINYSEIADYISDPGIFVEKVISLIMGESDKEFSLFKVIPHLEKYLKQFNPDVIDADEKFAINRAALIRHKITHRYGQIDNEFLREMAKNSSVGPNPTLYEEIGKSSTALKSGERYLVNDIEISKLSELINTLSSRIERIVCSNYTSLISYDPFDFNHEVDELIDGLKALQKINF